MFKSFQSRHTRLRLLITVSINDYASLSARITYELVRAGQEVSRIATQSGDAKMNDLLKGYAAKRRPAVKALPEDIALLLQSGGTTGTARGIMLSHKAMVAEGAQIKAWTKPILTEWEDPVMITPPLFHVYGNAAIAAAAIMGHNPMVLIPDPRDHKDLIKTIKKTEPAFFPAVPTLFTALANHPDFKSGKMDFKFMKLCLSGAAPFATGARTAFEALTGHRIFQAYGLTETTGAITIEPLGKLGKEGSVGLPLPDVVIKIVDIETGNRDLPNGETGEIIVKCPQVMTGFWNSLEETTEMIKDGWLHTGDIGHLDKDGYLFLTSRKKQLIKVSGFQVWPQEIVEVLKMHPMVEDACVGGIPDPVQGEAVKAWVVLRKGYETNATALQAFCRQKLTAYKIPRYVEFRDSLPRNLYGQELCRKLVEEEKARNAPPHVTG